jgi:hypothetical protein
MKLIRRLVVIMVLLATIFVGVGLMLPGRIQVERSTVIQAQPAAVFPFVNDFRRFNQWSPWQARDPQTTYAFTGPNEGVGSRMTWQSAQHGDGAQEIVESQPNERVVTALDFGEMGAARAAFRLSPEAGGTRVSWSLDSQLPYHPLARWFGLMLPGWIGADYEQGLARLKTLVEKGAV